MAETTWDGGTARYHASRSFVMYGPMIVKVCMTHTGARLAAWRLRRKEANGG